MSGTRHHNNIRRFRLERQPQWRQQDLAARLGVSQQEVSEWESGTRMPCLVSAFAIAAALGVSVEAVFFVQYVAAAERVHGPVAPHAPVTEGAAPREPR